MHLVDFIHWFDTHPLAGKIIGALVLLMIPHLGSVWAMIKTRKQMEVTTATMQRLMASKMKERAASLEPDRYFTLDVEFETGQHIKAPMFMGEPVEIAENVTICVSAHSKERTIATLQSTGFGYIQRHRHDLHHERLEIKQGIVTHRETGTIYREGDVWEIQPGEFHSATFDNAIVIITYIPPLKRASEQPANLRAMESLAVA